MSENATRYRYPLFFVGSFLMLIMAFFLHFGVEVPELYVETVVLIGFVLFVLSMVVGLGSKE